MSKRPEDLSSSSLNANMCHFYTWSCPLSSFALLPILASKLGAASVDGLRISFPSDIWALTCSIWDIPGNSTLCTSDGQSSDESMWRYWEKRACVRARELSNYR